MLNLKAKRIAKWLIKLAGSLEDNNVRVHFDHICDRFKTCRMYDNDFALDVCHYLQKDKRRVDFYLYNDEIEVELR